MYQQMYGNTLGLVATVCITISVTVPAVWLGCLTSFMLGRYFLKHHVKEIIEANPVLNTMNEIINEDGWKFGFLMCMNPVMPMELLNLAISVTDISFPHFAIAVLGAMPFTCFEVYTAVTVSDMASSALQKNNNDSSNPTETIILFALSAVLI